MRRLFCILLLICLPLQSFAAQFDGVRTPPAAAVSHALAHDQSQLHHHDDDGTVHYDESEASLEHAADQSSPVQFSLINPGVIAFMLPAASLADYPDPVSYIPDPCLDDPQRPPSFAPGLAAGG